MSLSGLSRAVDMWTTAIGHTIWGAPGQFVPSFVSEGTRILCNTGTQPMTDICCRRWRPTRPCSRTAALQDTSNALSCRLGPPSGTRDAFRGLAVVVAEREVTREDSAACGTGYPQEGAVIHSIGGFIHRILPDGIMKELRIARSAFRNSSRVYLSR